MNCFATRQWKVILIWMGVHGLLLGVCWQIYSNTMTEAAATTINDHLSWSYFSDFVGYMLFPLLVVGKPLPTIQFAWWGGDLCRLHWFVAISNVLAWAMVVGWWKDWCQKHKLSSSASNTWIAIVLFLSFVCFKIATAIPFSEEWRDFISISGTMATVIGFAAAVVSLWWAYRQLVETKVASVAAKSAAEAAETATRETITNYQTRFFRYAITIAQSHFRIASTQVRLNWFTAAANLQVIVDHIAIAQPLVADPEQVAFSQLVTLLQSNLETCHRMASGDLIRFPQARWDELVSKFWQVTNQHNHPFLEGGADNAN